MNEHFVHLHVLIPCYNHILSEAPKSFLDAAWNGFSRDCGMRWYFISANLTTLLQNSTSRRHVGSSLVVEALAMKKALEDASAISLFELNM